MKLQIVIKTSLFLRGDFILEKKELTEFLCHYDAINTFNKELYNDIFTEENIVSRKKAITIGGIKYYGYYLEKGKELYFLLDAHFKLLPLKVMDYKEIDYKGDVINFITKPITIKIPSEKRMNFRELVDLLPAFNHSNKTHFDLFKIASIAAYVDRVNFRTVTDAGFGKDSVINVIAQLVNSTANIYGATFPKLEFSLNNKVLVLNELGNLKKDDKFNMQEFMLAVGAYSNSYTKRSRKTQDTQEQYDISKISLIVFYNLPHYYITKSQEYFDTMFTDAVINRFIPLVFDGRLTTSFEKIIDKDQIVEYGRDKYKDIIATLNFYRNNPIKNIKYELDKEHIKFSEKLKRYERTFNTISKYISEFAETKEEFDYLTKELYSCYKKYDELVQKSKLELK